MVELKPVRRIRLPASQKPSGSNYFIEPSRLVFIITALFEPEQVSLEKYLKASGSQQIEHRGVEELGAKQWRLTRKDGDLLVAVRCLRAAGNGKAGVEFMRFSTEFRPQLTCFCGIAGSLNPQKAPLGTVVASTEIEWRGYDK